MDKRTPLAAASGMLGHDPVPPSLVMPPDSKPSPDAAPLCAPEWLERIAHDIRSPVGVLAQTLEILQERLAQAAAGTPVDASRPSALAGRAIRRLEVLADRLSLHATMMRGSLELYPQRVDLAGIVLAAIEDVWRVGGRREVTLERSIPERCDVRGDPPKLERAVAELLVNALHHARRRLAVTLTVEEPGPPITERRALLAIEDDGPGVTPEAATMMFQPRAPSHGGLGIGLVMARGIARAHGGDVVLDSPTGEPGARFVLVLPLLERAS